LCQRDGEATHSALVDEFIKHKQGRLVIEESIARCPEHTKEKLAGNMVDWLSKEYTSRRLGGFQARFKRRKLNQTWAYSRS
jgi:hypothetical protein